MVSDASKKKAVAAAKRGGKVAVASSSSAIRHVLEFYARILFPEIFGYQLPLALVGLIPCLALWDLFKFCVDRWELHRRPSLRQTLLHIAQCATAVILFFSNVQFALLCALGVSYAVLILHASFRKLTLAKQSQRDGNRRIDQR